VATTTTNNCLILQSYLTVSLVYDDAYYNDFLPDQPTTEEKVMGFGLVWRRARERNTV